MQFESPMDLHYSQTNDKKMQEAFRFESPMDLHYSQTASGTSVTSAGLNPLWIYTTLKRKMIS